MKTQHKIMDWLRANNITPSDVPITAVPELRNGRIICPVYLRRDGAMYLVNPGAAAARPAMGEVDVPLLVEATDGIVREWLAGRVR